MDVLALALGVGLRIAAPAVMLAAILYAWRRTQSRAVLTVGLASLLVPLAIDLGADVLIDVFERNQGTPGDLSLGTIVAVLAFIERMAWLALLTALIWVSTTTVHASRIGASQ